MSRGKQKRGQNKVVNLEQLAYLACLLEEHTVGEARDVRARQPVPVLYYAAVAKVKAYLYRDELLLV